MTNVSASTSLILGFYKIHSIWSDVTKTMENSFAMFVMGGMMFNLEISPIKNIFAKNLSTRLKTKDIFHKKPPIYILTF